MNDEGRFLPIEERLQSDARRLLAHDCRRTGPRLWSEYQRRRRRRTIALSAVTTVALLAAGVVGVRFARHDAERFAAPRQEGIAANPLRATPTHEVEGQVAETPLAIPFVIEDPASGKPILSGLYVPEWVEPVDLEELSPAERDAVRAMLGMDEEPPLKETI
jgi:hypothetical protein